MREIIRAIDGTCPARTCSVTLRRIYTPSHVRTPRPSLRAAPYVATFAVEGNQPPYMLILHQTRAPRSSTRRRTVSTTVSGGVSWPRISATPICFRSSTSSSGITHPRVAECLRQPLLLQQLDDARKYRHMSPGEDADPYHIDVLYGGGHYVFRPAMQSRVDHFHPGVAQSTRDDFGTTIMSIEAYLGDQNANRSVSLCHTSPPLIPRTQDVARSGILLTLMRAEQTDIQ